MFVLVRYGRLNDVDVVAEPNGFLHLYFGVILCETNSYLRNISLDVPLACSHAADFLRRLMWLFVQGRRHLVYRLDALRGASRLILL